MCFILLFLAYPSFITTITGQTLSLASVPFTIFYAYYLVRYIDELEKLSDPKIAKQNPKKEQKRRKRLEFLELCDENDDLRFLFTKLMQYINGIQNSVDEFDNNRIPLDDPYLIGTFHYYDPFTFTKQGANDVAAGRIPGNTWGTTNEFLEVETDFDAVMSANMSWAARNNTQPLPIYMGEFGVDNEADNHHSDRKKWLSWIRMQAERETTSSSLYPIRQ